MRKQSITFILVCFTSLISIVWKPTVSMSLGSSRASGNPSPRWLDIMKWNRRGKWLLNGWISLELLCGSPYHVPLPAVPLSVSWDPVAPGSCSMAPDALRSDRPVMLWCMAKGGNGGSYPMTNIRVIQTCLRWSSLGLNAAALQFLDKVVQDLFDDVFLWDLGSKIFPKNGAPAYFKAWRLGLGTRSWNWTWWWKGYTISEPQRLGFYMPTFDLPTNGLWYI